MEAGLEINCQMKEHIIHSQQAEEKKYPFLPELICLQILEDYNHCNLSRMLLRMWSG